MIRCNLSVLLSERNQKITKVSNDTGVSRTTLTALCGNLGKGIQFDTMNTLCTYLSITPEQLFSFVPIDIEVRSYVRQNDVISEIGEIDTDGLLYPLAIEFTIIDKGRRNEYDMVGFVEPIRIVSDLIRTIEISLGFSLSSDDGNKRSEKNNALINILQSLPMPFLNDLKEQICQEICGYFTAGNRIKIEGMRQKGSVVLLDTTPPIDYFFYWPNEIAYRKEGK